MSRIEELISTLDAMDDNPGWLSGDKKLVAQLCRCVSEIGNSIIRIQNEQMRELPTFNELVEKKLNTQSFK